MDLVANNNNYILLSHPREETEKVLDGESFKNHAEIEVFRKKP